KCIVCSLKKEGEIARVDLHGVETLGKSQSYPLGNYRHVFKLERTNMSEKGFLGCTLTFTTISRLSTSLKEDQGFRLSGRAV
ncbi:unnamed protein product, partial [Cylicocyclus nassatus]